MSSIWPILHYDHTEAARKFLVDVLGFREELAVRDAGGDIVHAELSWPDGGRLTFGGTKHGNGVHAAMRAGTSAVYVVTNDVAGVHERVARAGSGTIVQPPADTQFGAGTLDAYACTIADPEGNLWTFGTYRGAGR
jgi:uncharacterized glyoxalase superfamily protein PhnB